MRLVVFLVTFVFAGCLDVPSAPDEAASSDSMPSRMDWTLPSCLQVGANMLLPAEAVQARLPPGFTVSGGPGGLAIVGVEALQCATATIGGASGPLDHATVWTPVLPPPDLAVEDARHYYRWEILISAGDWPVGLRDLAAVQDGSVQLNGGPAVSPHQASIDFAELGSFTVDGVATRDFGEFGYTFVDFTLDQADGFHSWQANLTARSFSQGNGVVTLPTGSWVAQMAGAPHLPATTWVSEVEIVGTMEAV